MTANRRDFLRNSLLGSAGISLAGYSSQSLARIDTPHKDETLKPSSEVYGFCDMCYWRCGLKVKSRDGKAVKIDGNIEHPNNRGVVCGKGNAGLMVAYDPDRLKYPMIRVGKRGSGEFKKVSWEEALDFTAQKLLEVKEKYGSHSLALVGHGTWEKPYHRLAHAFGTPNTTSPVFGLCCGARGAANMMIAGKNLTGNETIDLENTKYFLMMGRNVTESLHNGETLGWIDGVANGAKVVYVDPRYTITASKAKEWLAIKPLTDHAFLLALIHVVIKEKLYDKEFVAEYTQGLDELWEVVKNYTPEWAEKETDITAETTVRIAHEMAEHAPSVIVYSPRRLTRSDNDFGMGMAIATLNSLFGVWDRKGGIFTPQTFKVPEPDLPEFKHAHGHRVEKGGDFNFDDYEIVDEHGHIVRADGAGVKDRWVFANPKYGLTNEMWKAISEQKPYPIKALITAGGNAFTNTNDREIVETALHNLDFYVAADVMPNEMNRYADVILPEATYLERYDDLQIGGAREGYVAIRMPAMKPLHGTRDAWTICKQLANRLDLGDYFPHENIESLIEDRLSKVDLTRAELEEKGIIKTEIKPEVNFPREYGKKSVFPTPSGKVEFIPSALKQNNLTHILQYKPQVSPNDNEFYFTFARVGYHTHARTQNNIWLADLMAENELWIHPESAEKYNIKSGDKVKVTDRRGHSQTIKTKVTIRIRKDTVFMVHGFGQQDDRMKTAYQKGALDAYLASNDQDQILGTIAMGRSLVTVEKI